MDGYSEIYADDLDGLDPTEILDEKYEMTMGHMQNALKNLAEKHKSYGPFSYEQLTEEVNLVMTQEALENLEKCGIIEGIIREDGEKGYRMAPGEEKLVLKVRHE